VSDDRAPSQARQLLLLVGLLCMPPVIAGAIETLGAIAAMRLPDPMGAFLLAGGLSGGWGTETLRRRPGHRTLAAVAGTIVGVVAAGLLFWMVARTMP